MRVKYRSSVYMLTVAAMLFAIGMVLPFLTGQVPRFGNMLLPMHLPVILCGMICGWKYGCGVGFLLPLCRSLIFGMPLLYPNAISMAFELAAYGFLTGLLFALLEKRHVLIRIYCSMLPAMISGRLLWGCVQLLLLGLQDQPFGLPMFLSGAFLGAIPGIVLQLIAIPALMALYLRFSPIPPTGFGEKKPLHRANMAALNRDIERLLREKERVIIAIDGPSCGGKTSLGKQLAWEWQASLIHMDDFYLQPFQRTEERLREPGGNVDRERFLQEVLEPLKGGEPFSYRPYDCHLKAFLPAVAVDPHRVTVIEGSYSCHPALRPYYDYKLFLTVSDETQKKRLKKRDPDRVSVFQNKWIPLENNYFQTLDRTDFDAIIGGKGK